MTDIFTVDRILWDTLYAFYIPIVQKKWLEKDGRESLLIILILNLIYQLSAKTNTK